MKPIPRSRIGVTLIEIIVMVLIVFILAAMIIPVLPVAHEAMVNQMKCANNLKNIATAFMAMSSDQKNLALSLAKAKRKLPGFANLFPEALAQHRITPAQSPFMTVAIFRAPDLPSWAAGG